MENSRTANHWPRWRLQAHQWQAPYQSRTVSCFVVLNPLNHKIKYQTWNSHLLPPYISLKGVGRICSRINKKCLTKWQSTAVIVCKFCWLYLVFIFSFVLGYTELPEGEGLSVNTDMSTIVKTMAAPDSGLDVRDRMWLKITIPNAFIGVYNLWCFHQTLLLSIG